MADRTINSEWRRPWANAELCSAHPHFELLRPYYRDQVRARNARLDGLARTPADEWKRSCLTKRGTADREEWKAKLAQMSKAVAWKWSETDPKWEWKLELRRETFLR